MAVAVEEGREAARPQVQEEGGLCWSSWRFFSGHPGAHELERRKRERLKILLPKLREQDPVMFLTVVIGCWF